MENVISNIISEKIFFTCLKATYGIEREHRHPAFEKCAELFLQSHKLASEAFIGYVAEQRKNQPIKGVAT